MATASLLPTNHPHVTLDGRRLRVVITGSSKGFGRALALQFARNGHKVVINARSKHVLRDAKEEFGEECGEECGLYSVAADVSKYGDNLLLYRTAIREMGGVDVWINNAGTNAYKRGTVADLTPGDVASIVDTNLIGTVYGSQMAIRAMKDNERGGVIINLEGSGLNAPSVPGYAVYESTKQAIGHFSECLRSEVRDMNIHVCTLSPGMLCTDMTSTDDATKRAIAIIGSKPEMVAAAMYAEICRRGGTVRRLTYLTPVRAVLVMSRNAVAYVGRMVTDRFRRSSP